MLNLHKFVWLIILSISILPPKVFKDFFLTFETYKKIVVRRMIEKKSELFEIFERNNLRSTKSFCFYWLSTDLGLAINYPPIT